MRDKFENNINKMQNIVGSHVANQILAFVNLTSRHVFLTWTCRCRTHPSRCRTRNITRRFSKQEIVIPQNGAWS